MPLEPALPTIAGTKGGGHYPHPNSTSGHMSNGANSPLLSSQGPTPHLCPSTRVSSTVLPSEDTATFLITAASKEQDQKSSSHDPRAILLIVSGGKGQAREDITPALMPPQSSGVTGPFGASPPTPLPPGLAPLCCLGKIYSLLSRVFPLLRSGASPPDHCSHEGAGTVLYRTWSSMWCQTTAMTRNVPTVSSGNMSHGQ